MEDLPSIIFGAVISTFIGILGYYINGRIQDQRWRKENIYKPLYNEINNLNNMRWVSLLIDLHTRWSELDSYSKLRVDKKLRKKLDEYEESIRDYNLTVVRNKIVIEKFMHELEKAVKKAFSRYLTPDGEGIYIKKDAESYSYIKVRKWMELFINPLLVSTDGKELCEKLIEYSEKRSMGHEKFFRKLWAEDPEVFNSLANEISNVKQSFDRDITYEELKRKWNTISQLAFILKQELEKRIRKIW